MTITIHPLQESSYHLLRDLYLVQKHPLTKAMLSVFNRYYPSIEDILATLSCYNNDSLVISFIEKHSSMIESATMVIAQPNTTSAETPAASDSNFDSVFGSNFGLIDAYGCMKKISMKEIEDGLSSELSRLCGEDLHLEISSIQKSADNYRTAVELKANVKPKGMFRESA